MPPASKPSPSDELALAGLRVLDLADEKGELAGRLLADYGADVVRVEPPEGARSRQAPPFQAGRSLYFAYRNFNKRGLALELSDEGGRARLRELATRADVLIESFEPGGLAARGLDAETLRAANPGLVVLSISDFGASGPYRDWVATDATLEALGGMQFKAGLPDQEPLLPPATPAWDIAGILGAFAVLSALFQRTRTGHGQTIDLSALLALAQQTDWSFSNGSYTRAKGQDVFEMRAGSGPMYKIYACKTGYVRLVILSPRQWKAMREWLGDPEYLRDPLYDSFLGRMQIADALAVLIGDLFATMDHQDLALEAQRRGIVCTPVLRPEEVLANEHFVSRGTFVEAEYAPGATGPIAAGFSELDGVRQGYRRRAPEIGEHDSEVQAGLWAGARPAAPASPPAPSLPFEGLRVLDFGIGGVGVEASRFFAQYGADVIKIESRSAPDFIRVVMSTEMSASFASSSNSKRAFGVNLKEPRGLELLHRLVEQADVVIENNSTGAMQKMGVGYETLRRLNPRVVMASSQLLGSRGAWADWIGYGPSTQPVGGLVHLWNYEGQDAPAGSTSIFPDHLAGRLTAISALAALLRRERTGEGGHAEVAQVETVTGMIGDLLLKTGLEPGSVAPTGNRSERGAPWGAYPCLGVQQWVVITVRDDDDWKRLCMTLNNPAWAAKPEYETAAGRRAAQAEIDAHLREWTSKLSKNTVTQSLQMFRVPVAPMLTGSEQLADPHFQARGYVRWVDQQDLGWIAFEGPCFRASGMSDVRIHQAPRVGEHTREIARALLGLGEGEFRSLVEAGVLEVPRT
jgi:crotonobetainyl-CoA:carnitine CoA-transferase CaiB-like acyl-CoA transferase